MKKHIIVLLLALGAQTIGSAQKFSIKDVTKADLENLTYAADTAAGAVILHDVGKLDGQTLDFRRQLRVKILKKSGLEWGNWTFDLPSKGDFKVSVYNLDNGEILREKATSKTIYSEEVVDGYFVFKVFAPNVRVGSIIDIAYTHSGPPSEWWFQNRIPVIFNELMLEPNDIITFNKTHFGFEPIETVNVYTWRARNVSAFHVEPFVNDYTNYVSKFSIQLRGAQAPGLMVNLDLGSSWKAVNNRILESTRISGALKGGGFHRDFINETKLKAPSAKAKIQAVYDYVQRNVKWDGRRTIYPSVSQRNVFLDEHTGNAADINLTIVALLRDLGVNCDPVVLSTRDNGLILPYAPNLFGLNYVVAYVKQDSVQTFIDGTVPGVMPGILPAYCINGSGLIVKLDTEEWVELTPSQSSVKRQSINIKLDKSGTATASVNNVYSGYGYLSWSKDMKDENNDLERIKNKIQKDYPEVSISKYEILRDEPANVNGREQLELDGSQLVIDAGQEILFNPFVLSDLAENPFLSEVRKYPVDMNFPVEISSTVIINLNGLTVKQLPQSIRFAIPDKSASFSYTAGASGNTIQLRLVFKIEKQIYTQSEYLDLRRFYGEVVKKTGAFIELTKI